jgi:hypothetical protein
MLNLVQPKLDFITGSESPKHNETAKNNPMGTSMFGTKKESSDFPTGSECPKHMLAPSVSPQKS